ncbi:MAG: hypothetical protein JO288_14360 [Hyphomicrobiales bacterium]|nr:hypothetical protein [Hyphomicrobiales bacterium]
MIRTHGSAVGGYAAKDDSSSLWLTLFVTTLMVALTAYVLSGAFFEPGANGPAHRAAATIHARS